MNVEHFDWQIGQLPAGWRHPSRALVVNGTFCNGPMAAMYAAPDGRFLGASTADLPVVVRFHERDAVRVQRWIMWLHGN